MLAPEGIRKKRDGGTLTAQALHATYGEELVTLGEETVAVHSHHDHG